MDPKTYSACFAVRESSRFTKLAAFPPPNLPDLPSVRAPSVPPGDVPPITLPRTLAEEFHAHLIDKLSLLSPNSVYVIDTFTDLARPPRYKLTQFQTEKRAIYTALAKYSKRDG